jgi:PPE-repeat protein
MDFALLPPEINSGRMYVGPGSGPMLAAAAAWEALAAELHSTASAYQSVITALTAGPWLGPSSAAMAAAAYPYVTWVQAAAVQAEQTATQAGAAAAAYEMAFAETVPPPVIAANRTLLMSLVATNILGQNTPAIAATEAQYAEMWAQDAGAMYGYAGSSASAASLTPFSEPPSSTNPGGQTGQSAAVAQALSTSAGKVQGAVSSAQQSFSAAPTALNSLAAPAAAPAALGPLDVLALLANLSGVLVDPEIGAAGLAVGTVALPYDVGGYYVGVHTDDIVSGWAGVQPWPGTAAAPPTTFPVITNPGSAFTAGMGEAKTISGLSVPKGWATAAPEVRPAALALPAASAGAAAELSGDGVGSLFGQMAVASMAGRAMAGTGGAGVPGRRERVGAAVSKPGEPREPTDTREPTTSSEPTESREPTASRHSPPGGPITSIAAELRELASLRDAGILTDEEFNEQKKRLLPH